MTTLLWTVGIIAELVLIVFAFIGYRKFREDIRVRDHGYGVGAWPMDGAYERRDSSPAFAPVLAPTSARGRALLALPAPAPKRPKRSLPSYVRLAADNGSVPAYRSQANFAAKGKLRSVPRSVAGYIGW